MILVTGATGALGRPTVELLRAAGHAVRSLSRRASDTPDTVVADFAGPEQLEFRELARQWNVAHSRSRPTWALPLPGPVGRSFARGDYLGTPSGAGHTAFAQYAENAAASR